MDISAASKPPYRRPTGRISEIVEASVKRGASEWSRSSRYVALLSFFSDAVGGSCDARMGENRSHLVHQDGQAGQAKAIASQAELDSAMALRIVSESTHKQTRCPIVGTAPTKETPDAARRSVRPTPLPLGAEVERRRARALKTYVRPTPLPLRAEMPADRACAIDRHRMAKAGGTAPPSWTATLRGICCTCNAHSERSAQNQTPQHRCSS
jgi:hypothetical protein